MLKNSKVVSFCHLKKLVRPETFGPYHICLINPLTQNGHYNGRTAPLTSTRSILNIYSTNIRIEYFKHVA
jgi:hypothetical protein